MPRRVLAEESRLRGDYGIRLSGGVRGRKSFCFCFAYANCGLLSEGTANGQIVSSIVALHLHQRGSLRLRGLLATCASATARRYAAPPTRGSGQAQGDYLLCAFAVRLAARWRSMYSSTALRISHPGVRSTSGSSPMRCNASHNSSDILMCRIGVSPLGFSVSMRSSCRDSPVYCKHICCVLSVPQPSPCTSARSSLTLHASDKLEFCA